VKKIPTIGIKCTLTNCPYGVCLKNINKYGY
jgi:hypothetical protein